MLKLAEDIVLPYMSCFCSILLLTLLASVLPQPRNEDGTEADFGTLFWLHLTSFHGGTWGHVIPVSPVQRAIACVIASGGYMWRQIVFVLLLRQINQAANAKRYCRALAGGYLISSLGGCLLLAAINFGIGAHSAFDHFAHFMYFTWMSYHVRGHGELAPNTSRPAEALIAVIIVAAGNIAWVYPFVIVINTSLMHTTLATGVTVKPGASPP
jgi:hypothetical protein